MSKYKRTRIEKTTQKWLYHKPALQDAPFTHAFLAFMAFILSRDSSTQKFTDPALSLQHTFQASYSLGYKNNSEPAAHSKDISEVTSHTHTLTFSENFPQQEMSTCHTLTEAKNHKNIKSRIL